MKTPGKLITAPAVTIAALVASPFTAMPASAATGTVGDPSWISVSDGVTYESCVDIPFSLAPMSEWAANQAGAWGNIWRYYNYEVDLTLIGPNGTEADSARVYREADDQTQIGDDTGEFFSCAGVGTYVVHAEGFWCPIDYTEENPACKNVKFSRSFKMRAAKSTVVTAAKKQVSMKRKLKVTATVKVERSTGYYAADRARVVLQYKQGRKWVNYRSGSTNSSGKVSIPVRFGNRGAFALRAVVKGDDFYSGSTSKVSKVRVRG